MSVQKQKIQSRRLRNRNHETVSYKFGGVTLVKKYRQILAGFLAMNLAVSGIQMGTLRANASSETISSENMDITEEIQTTAEEGITETLADTVDLEAAGDVSDVEIISDDSSTAETDAPVDIVTPDDSGTTEVPVEPVTPAETETPVISTETETPVIPDTPAETEAPQEPTETEEPSTSVTPAETEDPVIPIVPDETEEPSTSSDPVETEDPVIPVDPDETEEPQTETETETETEEETKDARDIAVFTTTETVTATNIKLKDLKFYDSKTQIATIEDGKQLILLSYCAPEEIQNITIYFNGTDTITIVDPIKKDEELTKYFNIIAEQVVNGNEIQETENVSENTEATIEIIGETQGIAEGVQTAAEEIIEDNTESLSPQEADQGETTEASTIFKAEEELSYKGLGSEDYLFSGKINGSAIKIKCNQPFFNGLSSKVSIDTQKTIYWNGNGTVPMLARVYKFEADETDTDNTSKIIPFKFAIEENDTTSEMGSLIETVKAADSLIDEKKILTIADDVTYGMKVNVKPASGGDAGLICNTLEAGTIQLDGYTFPNTYTVESTNENAGGVIGTMGENTKLEITSPSAISITPTITAKTNAGGLVGKMESGTELVVNDSFTVNRPIITSDDTAGGVAGKAGGTTFSGNGTIKIVGPGEAFGSNMLKGQKVGGFVGHYIVNTTDEVQSMPENIEITDPHLRITGGNASDSSAGGNAGGYFGLLELTGTGIYNIGSSESENKTLSTYYENGPGYAYGGLIGRVTSGNIAATLNIQKLRINSYFDNGIKYHGGVIGELGIKDNESKATYLEISGVTVTAYNPFAANDSDLGFGGLVGRLGKKSILKARNVTVSTKSKVGKSATNGDTHIWEGGGIVGGASTGSVIELSGLTDLSGVHYIGRFSTGQLVGAQDGALIYARGDGNGNGWTFKRSELEKDEIQSNSSRWKVNDIGNYGEIIRLEAEGTSNGLSSDLIKINNDHTITLKSLVSNWSSNITINSTDEFALLAIAINSRGAFWADTEHVFNYEDLFSKDITFVNGITVDLTGTGILGLTRDNSGETAYTGNLDGNRSTIILDTGTEFGLRGNEKAVNYGSGKLYAYQNDGYHNSQGIFAKASGDISNLTVQGNIALTADRGNSDRYVRIGGIAAQSVGTSAKKTIDNLVIDELKITAEVSGINSNFNSFSVGGIYGDDSGSQELYIQSNSKIKPQINVVQTDASLDTKIYAGGILGQISSGSFKLRCDGVTVGGSITSDVSQYAYIGGLVGVIQNTEGNRWIEIANLTYEDLTINAPNATKACGGLFGAVWANVHVYFENESNATKLTVTGNTSISAPNAASVGGLVYRTSGLWEIQDNGIDMRQLSINGKEDVGLLVCRGEYCEKELIGGIEREIGALYLRMTAHWSTAYRLDANKVTVEGNTGVFDEFVAHTANTAAEITDNNKNGVISLATSERIGVNKDGTKCTTYVNRTAHGKTHRTNGCSRYYYDLDKYIDDAYAVTDTKNNGYIDTEQELLLWSVERYAYSNIKKYFYSVDEDEKKIVSDCQKCSMIGPASGAKTFDMRGYSYYPINLSTNMVVRNSTFTFYNQEIENAETIAGNKSTRAIEENGSNYSQHYTMHCGLFLNDRATKDTGSIMTTVNNVTFKGSIGRLSSDGGSGALFAGMVNGSIDNNVVYTTTVKVTGAGITLDGLKVTDYETEKGYAPLLINRIRDYTTLDVSGGITAPLKTKESDAGYTAGTPVASSLIGNVGTNENNNGSKQMNLSFSNIKVPDMSAESNEGIFSHATLLESFQYGASSVATYNFYQEDDYTGNAYDHHKVTYGKEISGSLEYTGIQKWYYNEENYGKDTRVVKIDGNETKTDFSSYLPYVCSSYNSTTLSHEIKVNQRVAEITDGCGTYTHPYVITTDRQMNIISEYLATGNARKDWRIRIVKDQTSVCSKSDTKDVILQYGVNDETNWTEVKNEKTEDNKDDWVPVPDGLTIDAPVMHRYLLNAYYDIQGENGKLTLKDFDGFGTSVNPFRGVITSSNNTELFLEGAGTCKGLIPYSYGSVVRNLKITYQGEGITLTKNTTANSASDYFPDACFGGVIGCVLGGDNIIDGVTVTVNNDWLTLTGSKKHLLQVGGYVGSVCGGGVIFRGMTDSNGLSDNALISDSVSANVNGRLYVNPYVGRVLDGFVFNESSITLDNTDKNYKINTLTSGKYITETADKEDSFEVDGSQGLLILSAIVNSGAASGGVSNAYKTETDSNETYKFGNNSYGKVRNADYSFIGKVTEENKNGDFAVSQADDRTSASENNVPYLIKEYCDDSAFNIANTNNGVTINLKSGSDYNYNMTSYGTAYQGISARYVTNAILSEKMNTPKGVIPQLASFDGNSVEVTVDMQVREYEDDDFHAASVGGLFNLLDVVNDGELKNLTVKSTKTTTTPSKGVLLTYYDSDGSEKTEASSEWLFKNRYGNTHQDNQGRQYSFKESVGVGGFAGSTTSVSAGDNNGTVTVKFKDLNFESMTVAGPVSSGGLLGNAGRAAIETIGDEENNTQLNRYSDTEIPIKDIAILIQPNKGVRTVAVNITGCSYDNLAVTASKAAGGFVGYVDGISDVTISSSNISAGTKNITNNVSEIGKADNSTLYAGGVFGYTKTNININTLNAETSTLHNIKVAAKIYAGGVVGFINGSKKYQIKNVTVMGSGTTGANISAIYRDNEYISAGGIIGEALGGSDNSIDNCHFKNADINNSTNFKLNQEGQRNGGIIGYVRSGATTISNCTVQSANVYGSRSGGIAGGVEDKTVIENCKVQGTATDNQSIKGTRIAGGIIGISSAKSASVRLEGCQVKYMQINSSLWGAGGLIGDVDYNKHKELYLFDCAVEDSQIEGTDAQATAGGISGTVRGKMTASNLLMSKVSVANSKTAAVNKVGILIGLTGDVGVDTISVAGLSLQSVTATKKGSKPVTDLYGVAEGDKEKVKEKSYFAFADYLGSSCTADEEGTSAGKGSLLNATGKFPYVVTSPKSSLVVSESADDNEGESLYSDGAFWTSTTDEDNKKTTFTVNAQQIFTNRTQAKDGHYAYSDTGVSENDIDFSSLISTYKTNQPGTEAADFPVLQITAGDTGTIIKYLDILTNGGFSQANTLNTSSSVHVTAETTVYCYSGGKFVKSSSENKALKVSFSDSKQISFSTTTDYDNGNDRFTLLTVTFTENDETENNAHRYNIQVPIIVRRMLEIDFSATLTYGTDFRSADYTNLTAHVLESFGSAITGYLTYTYNSADGIFVDYGWQSYIDAGGDMTVSMDKKIQFNLDTSTAKMPIETQLSLVDCRDGKVYYYTMESATREISLSKFKTSNGDSYKELSLGELMQVTARENKTSGSFIEVNEKGIPTDVKTPEDGKEYSLPTVRIKTKAGYAYYRKAESGEKGAYDIIVDEEKLSDTTGSLIREEYFLVITVPAETKSEALNGSLRTVIESSIPHQVHARKINGDKEDYQSSASTYQISSGYQQELKENIAGMSPAKEISVVDSEMKVDVVDKITFPNGQVYQEQDNLYLRFVGGIQNTINEETTSEEFPGGTTGMASFYIYTQNETTKTYYKYENGNWSSDNNKKVTVAPSYEWNSEDGSMELLLSIDGTLDGVIDLQGLRNLLKNQNRSAENSTFYVEVEMDAVLPPTDLNVIPQSTLGNDVLPVDYSKLIYSSQLSTVKESLSYSTNRASVSDTTTAYYRTAPTGVKLKYKADEIGQLGINRLDLQYLDASNEYSLIDTTAVYDLSGMKNLDDALKDSIGIRFTLTLLPKNTSGKPEDYGNALTDAATYMNVELKSQDSGEITYDNGTWSWIVPQESYWKDGNINTLSVFDGSALTQRILLKVNVANVENEGVNHYYSNYKVVLTAEILGQNNKPIEKTYDDDDIIYTLARINTDFMDAPASSDGESTSAGN